jgi:hypothetical protein
MLAGTEKLKMAVTTCPTTSDGIMADRVQQPRFVFDSIRDDVDKRKLRVLWELLDEAPPSLERLPLSTEVPERGLGVLIAVVLAALCAWSLVLFLQR